MSVISSYTLRVHLLCHDFPHFTRTIIDIIKLTWMVCPGAQQLANIMEKVPKVLAGVHQLANVPKKNWKWVPEHTKLTKS